MTKIRAELSKKNPLYIEKHAFYMVYHFALQYPSWKQEYADLLGTSMKAIDYDDMPHGNGTGDPTSTLAMRTCILKSKIDLVERTAMTAGRDLWQYLLYGVTHDVTYNNLRQGRIEELGVIPCGRNTYYQIRRMFFFLLYTKLEELEI